MKKILITACLILGFSTFCFADEPEDSIRMIDTTIVHENLSYRVQRISRETFDSLHRRHYVAPSKPVTDIKKVEKMLGKKYAMLYTTNAYEDNISYGLYEFCKKNRYRLLICESDGFKGYYPRERIMMYYGGHSSDQAFFIDSGKGAYNPEYSTFSANKKYSITGLHSGQDNVDYNIQRYDNTQNKPVHLCWLYNIWQQIPYEADLGNIYYIFEQFWVNNALYFRTGYSDSGENPYNTFKYVAITMPE